MTALVKSFIPPIFLDGYRAIRGGETNAISGDYQNWEQAVGATTGYDSDLILEKTRAALVKVKQGEAAYERDSVLFEEIQYNWPLLAGLMWVGAQHGAKLNVLDFGGSLGSTYFQNRVFLHDLQEVRWNIIEQPKHVAIGNATFQDETLRFYATIEACLAETEPNVVILGSVLQYLEHPYQILNQLFALPANYIMIDKTPFWHGETDKISIQKVPPEIYQASYPTWIFSKEHFLAHIVEGWRVMAQYDNPDIIKGPVPITYSGMILIRTSGPLKAKQAN